MCVSLSLRSMCVDLCRKLLHVFPVCNVKLFPHCFASLANAHHFQVHTRLRQNAHLVPCLSGAMTQPIVAKASAVLCDPANPTMWQPIHLQSTLRIRQKLPNLKAMFELSKQSSDALEMFSEYLASLPATHLDIVQSKTPTYAWEMFQDVGVCNFWPGLDLHDIIQGLVNVLAPLQTLMRVRDAGTASGATAVVIPGSAGCLLWECCILASL